MRLHEFSDLQILAEEANGIFVAAHFNQPSLVKLIQFCKQAGVPNILPLNKFHVTILASKVEIPWQPAQGINQPATPTGWDVWKLPSNGKNGLVLKLNCPYLNKRFQQGIRAGGTHYRPNFNAHVSVSYDVQNFDASKLPLPPFPLVVDHETAEVRPVF